MASATSTIGLSLALLLVGCVSRAAADVECPTALSYINNGWVFLPAYDVSVPPSTTALDIAVTTPANILAAITACESGTQPGCTFFNWVPQSGSVLTWFKKPNPAYNTGASMFDVVDAAGNLQPWFGNPCQGVFFDIRAASANMKSCFYNNQNSAEGLRNCLRCLYSPDLSNDQRTQCSSCVTNLRGAPTAYKNANLCPACVKGGYCDCLFNNQAKPDLAASYCKECPSSPVGYYKCRDCITNLRDSVVADSWTPYCTKCPTYQCVDCLVNAKNDITFNVFSKCGVPAPTRKL